MPLSIFFLRSVTTTYALSGIVRGVLIFLELLGWVIIISALLSWVLRPDHALRRFLYRFTGPLVRPFRGIANALMRKGLMLDISTLLAYFALRILRTIIMYIAIFLRIPF